MFKLRTMIAWGGAMLMAMSLAVPSLFGSIVFLSGMAAVVIFVVMPVVAMIVNPIVDYTLSTKLANILGDKGKAIVRTLFKVPTIRLGS